MCVCAQAAGKDDDANNFTAATKVQSTIRNYYHAVLAVCSNSERASHSIDSTQIQFSSVQ